MIDIASDNNVDEKGPQAPSETSGDWEGLADTQERVWEGPPNAELCVGDPEPEPEQHPRDRLEWYLMKLLAPAEDAPRERVPQQRLDVTETPIETRPLWQNVEEGASEARAAAGVASPATVPPPAGAEETPLPQKRRLSKSRKKTTIRSLARGERTGGGRQKLMTAMIPVLVILIVVVLRHPLGARPPVKAASGRPSETTRPVITDVQIAWEIPSPYEPSGRDPMKGTRSPVVAVESAGTAVVPAAPVVELVVTGILYSKDNPAAIVDTQVVHEGQQISGATVEKIDKDGIQFERNGRRWKQTVSQ